MYLLNLSVLQFAAVFGSIAAMSVALYLLDRSRRKQVVLGDRLEKSKLKPVALGLAVLARRAGGSAT